MLPPSSTLNFEAADPSEKYFSFHQTTQHHMSEDSNPHSRCLQNFGSCISTDVLNFSLTGIQNLALWESVGAARAYVSVVKSVCSGMQEGFKKIRSDLETNCFLEQFRVLLQSVVASFTSLTPTMELNFLLHISWQMYLAQAVLTTLTLDDHLTLQQDIQGQGCNISLVRTDERHVLSVFANASLWVTEACLYFNNFIISCI
jgi:hypothetical protein